MRRANTACAQVSRISTQSKRLTRGHRLSNPPPPPPPPHPHLLLLLPFCDSILPFLSLNTLPLARLRHSIFHFPFALPPLSHFAISAPFPLPPSPPLLLILLPLSLSPEDSIMLSLLVSLMSFTCQQRRECASSSPTKEKHPPVISENAAGRRGWVGWGETGREIDRGTEGAR